LSGAGAPADSGRDRTSGTTIPSATISGTAPAAAPVGPAAHAAASMFATGAISSGHSTAAGI